MNEKAHFNGYYFIAGHTNFLSDLFISKSLNFKAFTSY